MLKNEYLLMSCVYVIELNKGSCAHERDVHYNHSDSINFYNL